MYLYCKHFLFQWIYNGINFVEWGMKENWGYSRCADFWLDIVWVFIDGVTSNMRHYVFNISRSYATMVSCCMMCLDITGIIYWSPFPADFEVALILSVSETIISYIPRFWFLLGFFLNKSCSSSTISINGSGRLRMVHCFKYNSNWNDHLGIVDPPPHVSASAAYATTCFSFLHSMRMEPIH